MWLFQASMTAHYQFLQKLMFSLIFISWPLNQPFHSWSTPKLKRNNSGLGKNTTFYFCLSQPCVTWLLSKVNRIFLLLTIFSCLYKFSRFTTAIPLWPCPNSQGNSQGSSLAGLYNSTEYCEPNSLLWFLWDISLPAATLILLAFHLALVWALLTRSLCLAAADCPAWFPQHVSPDRATAYSICLLSQAWDSLLTPSRKLLFLSPALVAVTEENCRSRWSSILHITLL